jgi:hypothetical protein
VNTTTVTVLATTAALLVGGCRSLPPEEIERVVVSYHNPFPPADGVAAESFELTGGELEEFRRLCPDLGKGKGLGCASVYPPFTFEVHYRGRAVTLQFCCGELRTFSPDGNLPAPEGFREFLITTIQSRAGELDWGAAR